jgi:hypothetical protein
MRSLAERPISQSGCTFATGADFGGQNSGSRWRVAALVATLAAFDPFSPFSEERNQAGLRTQLKWHWRYRVSAY